jgi:hypothetical protein
LEWRSSWLRARQVACGGPAGAGERLRLGQRLLALGERADDEEAVLWGRVWRFDALVQLGQIDRVEAELDMIAAAARRLRSPLARYHLLRSRGTVAFGRGRFRGGADRRPASGGARGAGREPAVPARTAVRPRARLRADPAHCPAGLQVPEEWPDGEGLLGAAALWYLAVGRRQDARRIYAGLAAPAAVPPLAVLPYLTGYAKRADAFDDRAMAADVYDRLVGFADLFVCSGAGALAVLGSARLPLGVAAATVGRLEDAVRHLRAAAEANERAGLPPFAAWARYRPARVLAQRRRPGDRDEAAALAASAAAVADRLGMAPLRRQAQELAASLAGRAPGPLTAREREIAVLVSYGLTNQQQLASDTCCWPSLIPAGSSGLGVSSPPAWYAAVPVPPTRKAPPRGLAGGLRPPGEPGQRRCRSGGYGSGGCLRSLVRAAMQAAGP